MLFLETGVIIFFWKTVRALINEMMSILSDRQLKKLTEHKYKREGGTTLLEPALQPFWNGVVEKCPLWLAPNAITFIGLMINVITSLMIIYYIPDNKGQAPSWAHFCAAAGVFIYQTLDAIDGKQARRTGSASPLGELFDHGCDAISTVVLVVAALIHNRLPLELLMFLLSGSYFAFYLAHWVTYCTGALSFGKFDVIEVQFMMIGGFLISAVFGEDFWLLEVPYLGVPVNIVLAGSIVMAGVFQALPALYTILITGGIGRNGSTVAGTSVLFPGLPISTVLILMFVIAKKSELSGSIYQTYPCLYLFTFGLVFAKVTCKLIVAHMCKSELIYWDSVYFAPALLFLNQYFDFFLPEHYVLMVSFVYAFINVCHYTHAVSTQICIHLGIYCFSLEKRPPSADVSNSDNRLSASSSMSNASSKNGASNSGVTTRQQASKKSDRKSK